MEKFLILIFLFLTPFYSSASEDCKNVTIASGIAGVLFGGTTVIAYNKFVKKIENLIRYNEEFEGLAKNLLVCQIIIEEEDWELVSETESVVECKRPFNDQDSTFIEWNKNDLIRNLLSGSYSIVESVPFSKNIRSLLSGIEDLKE